VSECASYPAGQSPQLVPLTYMEPIPQLGMAVGDDVGRGECISIVVYADAETLSTVT
jgi:hypothetical protein